MWAGIASPAFAEIMATLLDTGRHQKYVSLVGGLLYLSICSRPDIAHAVMNLTRSTRAPVRSDWQAALAVLRFLKGHKLALCYDSNSSGDFHGYADASFAGDTAARKSTSGYAFFCNGGLGAISWRSKMQPIVTFFQD